MVYNDICHGILFQRGERNHDEQKSNDAGVLGRRRSGSSEVSGLRGAGINGGADTARHRSVPEGPAEKGGAPVRERGSGRIFKKPGSRFWWIGDSFRGKSYQESSGSVDRKEAVKLLRERLRKVNKPNFVDPAMERRWTLRDMLTELERDYERKQNRSFKTVKSVWQHL